MSSVQVDALRNEIDAVEHVLFLDCSVAVMLQRLGGDNDCVSHKSTNIAIHIPIRTSTRMSIDILPGANDQASLARIDQFHASMMPVVKQLMVSRRNSIITSKREI